MSDTAFAFIVPQHALLFNQGYCLSYILLPLEPSLYTSKLISAFDTLPNPSKKSILTTLWFSYSCEGDLFLNAVKNNSTYSANIRSYAADLLNRKYIDSITKKMMGDISEKDLNNMWRESFLRFSDEAIEEIDLVTRIRREDQKCR